MIQSPQTPSLINQIPEMALASAAPQNRIWITTGAISFLNERTSPTIACLPALELGLSVDG